MGVLEALGLRQAAPQAWWHPLERELRPAAAYAAAQAARARAAGNAALSALEPLQVAALAALAALLLAALARRARAALRDARDLGLVQVVAAAVADLPLVRGRVRAQQAAAVESLRASLRASGALAERGDELAALPREGLPPAVVKQRLAARAARDAAFAPGESRHSGTVYIASRAHADLLSKVYAQFALANPIHPDAWPSVARLEAEVVAAAGALLGGGPGTGVVGSLTSGGTESILTAVLAARGWAAERRGVRADGRGPPWGPGGPPELVLAPSAHPAFLKAAHYFGLRVVTARVGPDLRLSGRAVAAALSRRTALVVASAPCYPWGVIDCVEEIAAVCARARVPLHVDACLGGFFLPFARRLADAGGRFPLPPPPPFDFGVPGVTSMSADTHKYGQAHKGTSVVLFRSAELRRHQFTACADWPGGAYISPGLAGSRPGALGATAWAALQHLGEAGLEAAAAGVAATAAAFAAGVAATPGLALLAPPDAMVVAFGAARRGPGGGPPLDIYRVNDALAAKGWRLTTLQRPRGLHFCFTAAHGPRVVDALLADVRAAAAAVTGAGPGGADAPGGTARLYGMAASVPDRRVVKQFLVAYQDLLLEQK